MVLECCAGYISECRGTVAWPKRKQTSEIQLALSVVTMNNAQCESIGRRYRILLHIVVESEQSLTCRKCEYN
jgi:hypothetical protein